MRLPRDWKPGRSNGCSRLEWPWEPRSAGRAFWRPCKYRTQRRCFFESAQKAFDAAAGAVFTAKGRRGPHDEVKPVPTAVVHGLRVVAAADARAGGGPRAGPPECAQPDGSFSFELSSSQRAAPLESAMRGNSP